MSLGVLNNLSAMYAANNLNNTQNSLLRDSVEEQSRRRRGSGFTHGRRWRCASNHHIFNWTWQTCCLSQPRKNPWAL
jgi:hypothetical protein